jgi:hypothetical protein
MSSRRGTLQGLTIAFLATAVACGGGCPDSQSAADQKKWASEIAQRHILPLRADDEITIKRDVHNVFVNADAATFAHAFHDVMRDPDSRFGLIRVDRLPGNVGRPFHIGEKFQGRYSLEQAVANQLSAKFRKVFGELVEDEAIQEWLCRIENERTSDYGQITRLELAPAPGEPHVLKYEYLEGSPIAGSSTFLVRDVTAAEELARLGVDKASRLEQVFEYQEQTSSFANFFSQGGLKLHNQVVWSQAEQSAARSGARILESDIPPEYRRL